MTEIESFYRIHDLHPTATGYFPLNTQNTVSLTIAKQKEELNEITFLFYIKQFLFD